MPFFRCANYGAMTLPSQRAARRYKSVPLRPYVGNAIQRSSPDLAGSCVIDRLGPIGIQFSALLVIFVQACYVVIWYTLTTSVGMPIIMRVLCYTNAPAGASCYDACCDPEVYGCFDFIAFMLARVAFVAIVLSTTACYVLLTGQSWFGASSWRTMSNVALFAVAACAGIGVVYSGACTHAGSVTCGGNRAFAACKQRGAAKTCKNPVITTQPGIVNTINTVAPLPKRERPDIQPSDQAPAKGSEEEAVAAIQQIAARADARASSAKHGSRSGASAVSTQGNVTNVDRMDPGLLTNSMSQRDCTSTMAL